MNSNNKLILDKIEKKLFKIIPICVFFYINFSTYSPRGSYDIIEKKILNNETQTRNQKIESVPKKKLRKKILQDIKLHSKYTSWNKKNVTKIMLNKEGKIIGYKFYNIFYPNYFTKPQTDKINTKIKFSKKSSCLQSIIIKYN